MGPLDLAGVPEGALLLVDSAPIIYFLEGHPKLGPRFKPLFEVHGAGRLRFAVTTVTVAEVLTGPLQAGDDALARRYRAILESWQPIALDLDIAESAVRLRASLRLKLADAVQAASALAINAAALVTHDRDFFTRNLPACHLLKAKLWKDKRVEKGRATLWPIVSRP
ncbi:MAG TPA: PIN domain-containing protein [Xanthobacteraceae bacterium]|nr:PIN domain-containing protein [Xanthobacteraceae bacterium]